MPIDTSKGIALNVSRRHFRKASTEEEIELKRARGEISCAECRRLKLKCDKKLPCGSCVRRGCPSICPNGLLPLSFPATGALPSLTTGSLSTGQGARPVLADTEHLHRKIVEMGHRIRSLEDALAIFQAGVSSDIHPLLTEELLAIKHGLEASSRAAGEHQAMPTDGLGTLTITDRGDSQYFGRTAGSEALFLVGDVSLGVQDPDALHQQAGAELTEESGPSSTSTDNLPQVSSEISRLASILPFNIAGISDDDQRDEVLDALLDLLPEYPRATTLCETYLENSAWVFRPIFRDELIDETLAPIYTFAKNRKQDISEGKRDFSPHTLAVLYMVFAHGALTDLTLPPYNSEAENYFHLARLALSLYPVYDLPTIQTLQALSLMAFYYANHGRHPTLDSTWSIMALASKLAQSIGLHRDPARFNMSPKATQRRRFLFWEILSSDMFHSMTLGRPPSISLSYVDCEFPEDETATINDRGEVVMGFFRWKHSFTKDVFIPVVERTLNVTPPTYDTILELDRKVREKVLPPSLNLYRSSSTDEYTTPTSYVRGRLLFQLRTATMLYIHRSFFAQAMQDFPSNPLRSPFAPSFLAAYRCASAIIKTTAANFQKYPELFSRFWTFWNHLLSGAIIVGTIVTRAPSSTMAPAAQLELDLALNLFRGGAVISPRAKSGLAILMRLKAHQAQGERRTNDTVSHGYGPTALLPETGVDELAMFGGQTRILVSKILSHQRRRNVQGSPPSVPTSAASSPSTISEDSHTHSEPIPEVHPSLVEYLSTLPPPTVPSPTAISASSAQFSRDQKSIFQCDTFSNAMTSGSSSQLTPMPTPSPFDEQFTQNFLEPDFLMSPPSGEMSNSFDSMELLMSGESGIDERWLALMQDVLNPPVS